MMSNDHSIHYIVIRNGSVLPELPADAFLEVPAIALDHDVRAIQVEPLPETARNLVTTLKQYEALMFEAAHQPAGGFC